MATLDKADPTVSAVVELASADEREAAGQPGMHDNQATAQLKANLTKAGFEVHAPFQTSFSIGGKKSLFEEYFAQKLNVDEDLLGIVTVDGGAQELSLDAVPDDVKPFVHSIAFVSPPSFHELTSR
ncbi:MAG TPA: hypothetical protein VHS52_01530 [Acidimicrobiales bacterium]|jgi:hypothetical protein|nr:hypothetical protein [Acidimicrobiales bacterium]